MVEEAIISLSSLYGLIQTRSLTKYDLLLCSSACKFYLRIIFLCHVISWWLGLFLQHIILFHIILCWILIKKIDMSILLKRVKKGKPTTVFFFGFCCQKSRHAPGLHASQKSRHASRKYFWKVGLTFCMDMYSVYSWPPTNRLSDSLTSVNNNELCHFLFISLSSFFSHIYHLFYWLSLFLFFYIS